jgi:hypothetical protein
MSHKNKCAIDERVGKVEIDPTVNPSVRMNARW